MADKNCDPCECIDMTYRNEEAWRLAVIRLLCDILNLFTIPADDEEEGGGIGV